MRIVVNRQDVTYTPEEMDPALQCLGFAIWLFCLLIALAGVLALIALSCLRFMLLPFTF
jgi:hypothetical protein